MGKKISTVLPEEKNLLEDSSEQIDQIQDDLYWVSLKLKGFGKLFFPSDSGDGREFDGEELNGIGEMITDFSKTISRIHDEVENFKLNLVQKER